MAAPQHLTPHLSSGEHQTTWLRQTPATQYNPLLSNLSTDVVVIGGGIAGITTAYLLCKKGKKVVLLEDGQIGSGETGRTTAHLMTAIDDRYFTIEKNHGKEGSKAAANSHSTAIDVIEEIVNNEQINCDFERLDGYLFLGEGQEESLLDKELTAVHDADLPGVTKVPSTPVAGINVPALKFPRQGQFDPMKYINALAAAIVRLGGQVYGGTHVDSVHGGKDATIKAANGFVVSCNDIVVATNVPINDTVTMYTKMEPYRSYVITATVPKGSVPKALYWDTLDPYHYIRLAPHNADSDLLIVGGEDHKVAHIDTTQEYEDRFNKLEAWARTRFPSMDQVVDRWSGQVTEPVDDVAYIGKNPGDHNNVYIITGDSGMGMTHGTIGGLLITDMIIGLENHPWAKLYNPSRLPLHEITEYIKHNIDVGLTFRDYLGKGDVKDIEDIQPGCGAIVSKGLAKHAVYRDEAGTYHYCSAVCPHLKAVVHWNPTEKTWDCPAHGSRFDRTGTVINGPSNVNLTKQSSI